MDWEKSMGKPKIAIVRGKFLNKYEMQMYEPLVSTYNITAFGSLTSYHDRFAFPVIKLPSPMDIPDFPYKMPILNRMFIDAHYLWGLENKLHDFDIIHTAETYFHYTQQCLNAKGKAKVVATVLENIPFNNEGIHGRKAFKKRSRNELDHIIALTNKTKEALLAEGTDPRKITVISHFVDTKRFHPVSKKSSKNITVLFVGRLEEEKGVLDIINAARLLPGVRFLFVGDGSLGNVVEHRIVSYDDMPEVYRQADIFVAPSKPTKTWEEQYCTVLLEAQAMGLPIVTTDTGGIPENVGDAGIIVPPGDVNAITKAVKRFIDEPKLRAMYSKKARERAVSVHDITIGANKLDLLYQHLL